MEITSLESVLLSHVYPDDVDLKWSAGTIESWDASLVRIETDTGLVVILACVNQNSIWDTVR